jgi:hypothetical protein
MITFGERVFDPDVVLPKARGREQRALKYAVPVYFDGVKIDEIAAGFVSDCMSTPRLVGWFKPRWWKTWGTKYEAASLWHDWLLKKSGRRKAICDVLFLLALISAAVSALESCIFWLAVRTRRKK